VARGKNFLRHAQWGGGGLGRGFLGQPFRGTQPFYYLFSVADRKGKEVFHLKEKWITQTLRTLEDGTYE